MVNVKSIIKEKDVIRGSHEHITDNIWDFYHQKLLDKIVNFNYAYKNYLGETVVLSFQWSTFIFILRTSYFVQHEATFLRKVALRQIANEKKNWEKKEI